MLFAYMSPNTSTQHNHHGSNYNIDQHLSLIAQFVIADNYDACFTFFGQNISSYHFWLLYLSKSLRRLLLQNHSFNLVRHSLGVIIEAKFWHSDTILANLNDSLNEMWTYKKTNKKTLVSARRAETKDRLAKVSPTHLHLCCRDAKKHRFCPRKTEFTGFLSRFF